MHKPPAAARPSYETFPELAEEIGEDPARFLGEEDPLRSSKRDLVLARIRGIDRLDVLDAWLQVETELDRGPRQSVINWLNQRKMALKEHGERPERTAAGEREPFPEKDVVAIAADGERVPWTSWRRSTADAKIAAISEGGKA